MQALAGARNSSVAFLLKEQVTVHLTADVGDAVLWKIGVAVWGFFRPNWAGPHRSTFFVFSGEWADGDGLGLESADIFPGAESQGTFSYICPPPLGGILSL